MQSVTLLRWLVLGTCLGGALGCGGDSGGAASSSILATLGTIPTRATQVVVSSQLDGKPATNTQLLTPPTSTFAVELPSTQSGHLVLSAVATDSDGCTQASSSGAVDLPTVRTELSIPLMARSPRKCGSLEPCAASTVCAAAKPTLPTIQSVWVISPTDIWAVGLAATLVHFDGTSWKVVAPPTGVTENLFGVWASAKDNVWVVGAAGRILNYNGTAWSTVPSSVTPTLYGIWGVSRTDIWAVGNPTGGQGVFLRYDGTRWSSIIDSGIGTVQLNSVWADNPKFIYACGVGGLLTRFNGTTWNTITSNTTADLHSIWGTPGGAASSVVFATGDGGVILRIRYDMPSPGWTALTNTGTSSNLFGIFGDGKQVVYAVGSNGAVVRADTAPYDKFVAQSNGSLSTLFGVSLAANGLLWTGGGGGFIGYLDQRP